MKPSPEEKVKEYIDRAKSIYMDLPFPKSKTYQIEILEIAKILQREEHYAKKKK